MKKNFKEIVILLAMPLLLILFVGKVLVTLYEIYSEQKQNKMRTYTL